MHYSDRKKYAEFWVAASSFTSSTGILLFEILQNHFASHIVVLATNENWVVNFWTTERLGMLVKMTAYLWTLESSHTKDKVHTWGRLVAPMTRTRSSAWPRRPSNSRRNSVFRRLRRKKVVDQKRFELFYDCNLLASCSDSDRSQRRLSISSIKMIEG